MKPSTSLQRLTLATLLVAFGAATFVPMAHADRGDHGDRGDRGGRRWKYEERGPRRYYGHVSYGGWGAPRAQVVFRDRGHFGAGPLFAGLVGGVILGSVLQSHAQPVVVHEHYYENVPQPVEPERVYVQPEPEPQYVQPEPEPQYAQPEPDRNGAPQVYDRDNDQPAPVYRYEDGNGERWWDTMGEATEAARGARGPHRIRVVDDRTNKVVRTLYWKRDHWISDDGREVSDD